MESLICRDPNFTSSPIESLPSTVLSSILTLCASSSPSTPFLRSLVQFSVVSRAFLSAVRTIPSVRFDDTNLFDADCHLGSQAAARISKVLNFLPLLTDLSLSLGGCSLSPSPVSLPLFSSSPSTGPSLKSLQILLKPDYNFDFKQWEALGLFKLLEILVVRAAWDGKFLSDYGETDFCNARLDNLKKLVLENVRLRDKILDTILKLCPNLTNFEYRHSLSFQHLRNPHFISSNLKEIYLVNRNPHVFCTSFWIDCVNVDCPNLVKLVVHRTNVLKIKNVAKLRQLELISSSNMVLESNGDESESQKRENSRSRESPEKFPNKVETMALAYHLISEKNRQSLLWSNANSLRKLSLYFLFSDAIRGENNFSQKVENVDDECRSNIPNFSELSELELWFWEPDSCPLKFAMTIVTKCPMLKKFTIGFRDFTHASFLSPEWQIAIPHFYNWCPNTVLLRYHCSSFLSSDWSNRWVRKDLKTYFSLLLKSKGMLD